MTLPQPRFEIRRWRVILVASNGEPLCVSEHLNSLAACHVNIAATVIAAASAPIVDLTRG